MLALTKLKALNIYMNKQATDELLAPLTAITTLEEISMSNSREVTTLGFLAGCTGLTELKASWCRKLEDISVLATMPDLRAIDIEDCKATDFSVLRGKPKLTRLDVAGTAFTDLSLLSESAELSSLEIHDTEIRELAALAAFPNLHSLSVSKEVPEAQVEALKDKLPNLRIRTR